MKSYLFYLVNVFAESFFGGNPLAVFPQADGLPENAMPLIAKQFNLSETVFAFSDKSNAAALRIFTPSYELPLAGHPILGAAAVLHNTLNLQNEFSLNTKACAVPIQKSGDVWQFSLREYTCQSTQVSGVQWAQALGVAQDKVARSAYLCNSGSPQILLQVQDLDTLFQAQISAADLNALCNENTRGVVYLWCEQGETVHSRLLYSQGAVVLADYGTGSACANLGAYLAAHGKRNLSRTIVQGDDLGRPNRLHLRVDNDGAIWVGGQVVRVGQGVFELPENF